MYSTLSNIDNNINKKCLKTANQHIKMISEGSRDTEDWSNDAENVKCIQIESSYFQ